MHLAVHPLAHWLAHWLAALLAANPAAPLVATEEERARLDRLEKRARAKAATANKAPEKVSAEALSLPDPPSKTSELCFSFSGFFHVSRDWVGLIAPTWDPFDIGFHGFLQIPSDSTGFTDDVARNVTVGALAWSMWTTVDVADMSQSHFRLIDA